MIVVVDDEDRENEGDLIILAEYANAQAIAFMAVHGRGLICLALAEEICDALALPPMCYDNQSRTGTAFTVSIEAATGVTTGISAADRARTIAVAIDPRSTPSDLARPGHVFPLRARRGGVLVRRGHTEAGVDYAQLIGSRPAAVICEIMNDDGTMARRTQLEQFCQRHQLIMTSVAQLVAYRHAMMNQHKAVMNQ
jgi:3,4-dihydroxy 2-butanone 4-phosphate synthase/GTP cyclohydrolase II